MSMAQGGQLGARRSRAGCTSRRRPSGRRLSGKPPAGRLPGGGHLDAAFLLVLAALATGWVSCERRGGAPPPSARAGAATILDIDESRLVDLTHPFDERTIYWPTARPFTLERVAFGPTAAGYWYAANNFCAAEHGGTHMDAPIHFAEDGWTADEVPLARAVGPACVIDVSEACVKDSDHRLTVDDLRAWESAHGVLPAGAIVLVRTGWASRWGEPERVFNTSTPADTRTLHFPGFSPEAARFLVEERKIDAVGIDTPSIDYGPSTDFQAHQIFGRANVPGFENLAHLEQLPATGATFIALPMKIARGSGAPTRAIALLP